MAARSRGTKRPLIDDLAAQPTAFDPYQAARILEALHPDRPKVGEGVDPGNEAVRFVGDTTFAFVPEPVRGVTVLAKRPSRLMVTMLNLVGHRGALPDAYGEWVRDRLARRDGGMKAFLDLFVHRLVSILVRGKRTHRPGLDGRGPDDSPVLGFALSALGLGPSALRDRLDVPDRVLLRYAALFAARPRSPIGLARILSDVFAVPVAVHRFRGAWLTIDPRDRTILGQQNLGLGRGAVMGERAWSQPHGVEIEVGPLPLAVFNTLLPGEAGFRRLAAITRFYLQDLYAVRLRLVLQSGGQEQWPGLGRGGPRLAWSAWATRPHPGADRQVVLDLPPDAGLKAGQA
ncbi:MAG: type VI secretion system baseplate subunit TssG [Rhodospirillaceae bacterium]